MRKPIVGVMGPGEGATAADQEHAYRLGQGIAQQGWLLLTGGRNAGVMEAASRGAQQAGGLTIGVLPGSDSQQLSAAIDIPILTGLGQARNAINVLSSDVVMACGMGTGTASEVALALKIGKPVILVAPTAATAAFFRELAGDRVWVVDGPEAAILAAQTLLGDAQLSSPH